jgi:hypothetical protein
MTPREHAGLMAVNTAVSLYLDGRHDDAVRTVQAAIGQGLAEEVATALLGITANALIRLGEATEVDPLVGWSTFIADRNRDGWTR